MTLNNWTVRTVSGCAGGLSREARVTLEVNCTSDTVEEVRQLAEAAPELLAALQFVLDCFDPDTDAFLQPRRKALLSTARAAIAKATREN